MIAYSYAADIARLGRPLVAALATGFEDTITMVRQHPYDEQEKILTGYKKLMEEQINVINSRIGFVKRVR
jgi:Na+-transporting methylmalonyl-CoA/oxaloacetate decarboxylase beta subunit